jgi:DNA-binding transcriptional regulator PaaX
MIDNQSSGKKLYATTKDILDILVYGGAIVIGAMVIPLAISAAIPDLTLELIGKVWEKYDQRRLKRTLKEMLERQMLVLSDTNREVTIIVTEKGKRQLLKYNIKTMTLNKPEVWDGKWRVVIFDVKEGKKSMRESLRRKMKQLEFYQLQKSVYVSPYPCEKELLFIRQYYLIGGEVSYFLATNLEQEDYLVEKFSLKK